jgi:ligand-binding sensor domain-containing protein/serine phosphatase RsbU (regulator of sigma subunit)
MMTTARVFCLFLLLLSLTSGAQTFRFKNYTTEKDGLYPYIYSIHQDPPGFLWLGTGEGLYRFDGINFREIKVRTGDGDNFINCGLNMGNEINWFGYNDGSLAILSGKEVKKFMPNTLSGAVTGLFKINNSVYAFSQNGITLVFDYNGNLIKNWTELTSDYIILSVSPVEKQKFLIGTDDGLYLADFDAGKIIPVDECPVTRINCIYKSKIPNVWWAGTDDSGILLLKNISEGNSTRIHVIDPKDINAKISKPVNTIIQDKFNYLWAGTSGEGLMVFKNTDQGYTGECFNISNGLPSEFIKTLFIDKEENLWIGTYGNGLAKFSDDYFTFHFQGPRNLENNILACFSYKDQTLFAKNNILFYSNGKASDIPSSETIPVSDKITAIFVDTKGNVWLGTQNSGIIVKKQGTSTFRPYVLPSAVTPGNINYITGYGNKLYIGSINGLYILNTENDSTIHISTNNGLPHNFISHIYIDIQGFPWIATPTNYLTKLEHDSVVKKHTITYNKELVKINSICQDITGKIWVGTYGHGVFMMSDTSFINYSQSAGLLSNYCYSIINDESNAIWVGHRQGLSCIKSGMIKHYGKNKDIFLDFNLNAACIDKNGWIWWGTNNGLICYDFRKNRLNKIPPGILLESILINDKEFPVADEFELPYGKYKIRFNYTGICMTEPELVSYSYLLEGFDKEWNEHSSAPYVLYPGIEDGTYTLRIKAFNSNGIQSENEAVMTLRILPPIWKRWWFILLVSAVIIYAFYLIIKIRERNHKKLEDYLKKTLDERTLEVRKQKEVIELKNKDITDSINYAKKIQEAILPSAAMFRRILPQSFILFRPRDIVSGDFYVAQSFNDVSIVIAADATGHGVPGAFMSLICSTIIKDILAKQHVKSPDAVLYELDKEVKHIFNLNEENPDHPKDGLDTTVCEIHHKTGVVRISSAMRPFMISSGGNLTYYKGSKHSIGGQEIRKKEFALHEFQLGKNDMIYLFTDGFADQFGGPKIKKLKISGLKKICSEITHLSTEDQKKRLEKEFDDWKGDEPQVDDVLIIGIRV